MKNIMIITPSLSGGGAEHLAADLSRELADKYNVALVVYQESEKEYEYKGTRYDLNLFSDSLEGKITCALKRCTKVKKLKRNLKTDLSISFLPQADYVNVFSKQKNEKVIISVVSNMSLVFPGGIKKIFRKFVLKHADHIVNVSEGVREDVVKTFKIPFSKASVIYNSCDIDALRQDFNPDLLRSLCKPLKGPYIITAGSFRHPKGHWHLIKAFSLVVKSYPQSALI
ncbi:MAG TPA: glycosyltransferase, partial [Clostridiales bacterium]|nr:glycosyltransferase [Clostridiales bacterium]